MRPTHRHLAVLAVLLFLSTPASSGQTPEVDISEVLEPVNEEEALVGSLLDLVLDPADVKAHIQLANLYAREERLDLAARAYRRALKIDPTSAVAWNNLGVIYLRLKRESKAMSCFKKAIDFDPTHSLAHYNMASVLDIRGKYDAALEHYRIAFHHRPDLAKVKSNPFLVYNEHRLAALLSNYRSIEDYALLVDSPKPIERTRVVGIAAEVPTPER